MNNRTNPKCRDAFIAERKRQGQSRGLEWHTFGADPEEWDWDTDRTDWEYRGWCLLWKPPSDVDPESILGKLKAWRIAGRDVLHYGMTHVSLRDLIDLIETQRQQIDDGIAGIQQAEERVRELKTDISHIASNAFDNR